MGGPVADDQPMNASEIEFYKNIGLCITEWANIEMQLFSLCSYALTTSTQNVAIIFHRTPSLSGRLGLTDELIQAVLAKYRDKVRGEILGKEWKSIVRDIDALFRTRNRLAHWPVVKGTHLVFDGQYKIISEDETFVIAMSLTEIHRKDSVKSKREEIKPSHLPAYHEKIVALRKSIVAFHHKIAGTQPPGRFAIPPRP
jgi:hypothetical protein